MIGNILHHEFLAGAPNNRKALYDCAYSELKALGGLNWEHRTYYTAVGLCCLLLSTMVCGLITVSHQLVKTIANGLISVVIIIPLYWAAFHRLGASRNLKAHIVALVEAVRH